MVPAGSESTLLRAPGGVLDPNDKTRMIEWWGDWDPLNDDAGEA